MSPIPCWCPTKSSPLINGHCTMLNRNKKNKSKTGTRLPSILSKRKESQVMSPYGKKLYRLDVLGGLFWKVTGKIRFPGYSRWSGKKMINWKKASKFRNTRGITLPMLTVSRRSWVTLISWDSSQGIKVLTFCCIVHAFIHLGGAQVPNWHYEYFLTLIWNHIYLPPKYWYLSFF